MPLMPMLTCQRRPRSYVGPARLYDGGGANQIQAFILSRKAAIYPKAITSII